MKVSVITGVGGKIIATMRPVERRPKDSKTAVPTEQLVAGRGQKSHMIDLPDNIANTESTDELHKAIKAYLGKAKKPIKRR